ncbi:thiol reductant ABC exporter subunit CydD [Paenibacillus yanchengensis]|uniref:Thiol reductant ABC exporter subunit CydD n=1 Tax=Paenibacillus yanchengensis TaxID=2035833 RepID=A0ABW4YIU2_9BACL
MDKNWLRLPGITPIMLLLSVFSLLQGVTIVVQSWFLAEALTALFIGNSISSTLQTFAMFALFFVLRHLISWLQRIIAGRFAETSTQSMSEQLLQKLFELGPRFASSEGSGKLVNLALEGITRVRTYLELSIPRIFDMLMITGAVWIAVVRADWISGIILLVAQPVLVLFFIILGMAARALADKQWKTYRILSQHFSDTLRGLETLRFLGRSKAHGETVERVAEQYRTATMKTLRVAFLSSFSLDFFSMLSVAFVAVGLGIRLIDGNMTLAPALMVLLLAPEYFLPIRNLGTDYHATLDGKEAWASVRAITELPVEVAEQHASDDNVSARKNKADDMQVAKQSDAIRVSTLTDLQLQAVTVQSDEGNTLLHNVTTVSRPGVRKIGIVGASGAGKSTLLHVLGGFLTPTSGAVNTVNGSIRTADSLQKWQQQMAYIPQHPYIFSMSLRDNITFYEPEATIEQIEQAIDQAELRSFVEQLPNGLEERIGEGGRAISGGQAQRIALARAWISKRPLLLLDEPTAHLDVETEWELKQTMLRLFADKNVILATHRLHWMKEMDDIWVLEQGVLVEQGTHQELMVNKGTYYQLLQASGGWRGEKEDIE